MPVPDGRETRPASAHSIGRPALSSRVPRTRQTSFSCVSPPALPVSVCFRRMHVRLLFPSHTFHAPRTGGGGNKAICDVRMGGRRPLLGPGGGGLDGDESTIGAEITAICSSHRNLQPVPLAPRTGSVKVRPRARSRSGHPTSHPPRQLSMPRTMPRRTHRPPCSLREGCAGPHTPASPLAPSACPFELERTRMAV